MLVNYLSDVKLFDCGTALCGYQQIGSQEHIFQLGQR